MKITLILIILLSSMIYGQEISSNYNEECHCWECPEGYSLITLTSYPPQYECWDLIDDFTLIVDDENSYEIPELTYTTIYNPIIRSFNTDADYNKFFEEKLLEFYLKFHNEYITICETPTVRKVFIEYTVTDTFYNFYDVSTAGFNSKTKKWESGGWRVYLDHKTKTAWKYEEKTYKPCFEGFNLFLNAKLLEGK